MRLRTVLFLITIIATAMELVAQQAPASAERGSLVYAIYISRHGVRSPTSKASQYDRYSSAPWPTWNVAPGYLTTHGYELMRLFGVYDRTDLTAQGLLSGEGCADAKKVTFHADSDQRTRETAKALAEGIFPGCAVPVQALDEGTNDPLFHQPPGSISPAAAARGAAAIAGRVGNNPEGIAQAYRAQLAMLDEVLKGCGPNSADHTRTSIFDVPASIDHGSDDHMAEIRGPLTTAATLVEDLLLEYTDGMDAKNVGWGCVDAAKLRTLLDLHTASFDLAQRTPAIANLQASALLHTIDRSLQQAMIDKPVDGAEGKPGDKALFLVGHDTNLANIAGALGLDWLADGRRNDTPPGSALIFELWKLPANTGYSVRAYFTAQTLEQMRQATPLTGSERPAKVPLFIPACSESSNACTFVAFESTLRNYVESSRQPK